MSLLKKILSKTYPMRTFLQRSLYVQILFTTIAFLAMAVFSYIFTSRIVHSYLIQNAKSVLAYGEAQIESDLLEPKISLGSFSQTIRMLLMNGYDSAQVQVYINELSEYVSVTGRPTSRFNGFYGYFETLPDGPTFMNGFHWVPRDDYKPTERVWYTSALAAGGSIVETPPFAHWVTGDLVIAYACCIFDDDGRRLGVVSIDVKIDDIGDYIINTASSHGGYGILFDRDLVVIVHPYKDFVGKPVSEVVPLAHLENDLRNGVEISERPIASFKNEPSIAFFCKLPNGWYLGMVTPQGPYYESVTEMMLFLGALGLALASALILILIRIDAAKDKSDKESRQKSIFLANMSHEIRTPMNAIIGMTTLGKGAPDSVRKDYCFTKIEDASHHLLGVINDILDMSKIESNKFELSPAEFIFEKMLRRVVNIVNFRVDEKHQKFSVHIDRNIPPVLIGDDQRLAQVITNLLGNAIKFTPEMGIIGLDARFLEEKDGICSIQISVKDTGIGISPEQQEKLFMSFEQAESSTTRKFGGTGLGLSISKSIVEMMGGRIWIDSELGKGATFIFTIQAKRGADIGQGLLSRGINWNNVRIMAIDDDQDILDYFKEITHEFGVLCDTAINGKEAIRMVEQKGAYHIYFVDWKMPDMDGIELARELKSRMSDDSVVIMISAAEWVTIAERAKKAGVDKFLSKPIFPSSIADAISEALGLKMQAEEMQKDIRGIFEGRRILLVEDVDINREIVQALLEPTGLKIDCAENGLEAVRMYSDAPEIYDMILMDVQMPKMDGYEATRRIREIEAKNATSMEFPKEQKTTSFTEGKTRSYNRDLHGQIPIVAMTANVFREDIEKCLEAGMDNHLGKPLNFDEVLNKLRTYLPNRKEAV
jgi:signal transduction histidine kinase/DNA-binding response OmpR family regulator